MIKSYRMVKEYGENYFIEKKSRFIGYVSPAYTEEDAVNFINSIKKKHYDATHNCHAYILGENSNMQRSSDDGEPSGTAGIPILEVIRKEGLTNTVVVVTRYFGGIMLGAGGLIRAYTEGAAIGIKAAGIISVKPFAEYKLSFDYSILSKLQYEMPKKNYIIKDVEYLDVVNMNIIVNPENREVFEQDVIQWTNGSILPVYIETIMLKVDEATGKMNPASPV